MLMIHFILFELNRLLLTKQLQAASWKNFPHTVTHFLYKNLQDDSDQLPFLEKLISQDQILTIGFTQLWRTTTKMQHLGDS